MFTVKLMKGIANDTIRLVEAVDVEVKMNHRGDIAGGNQHAIIVHEANGDRSWYYVGQPDWDMAVVENAAGKTTEVVRAPENLGAANAFASGAIPQTRAA